MEETATITAASAETTIAASAETTIATITATRAPLTDFDSERAPFAEQFLVAVSRGWEDVIRLLQSREADPQVREQLEELLAA